MKFENVLSVQNGGAVVHLAFPSECLSASRLAALSRFDSDIVCHSSPTAVSSGKVVQLLCTS